MPLISVIIPIYNAEKTLYRCVKSLLNQTVSSLELLLVNDGSTDNSLKICSILKEEDARIRVLDQANQGVSAARNLGLNNARGKYISFVDSDDWVEDFFFEYLLKDIKKYSADISICGLSNDYPNGRRKIYARNSSFNIMDSEKAICCMLENDPFGGFLVNRLYKKELFNNLGFNEKIAMCEDVLISIDLFHRSKVIVYNPDVLYHYYQSGNGVTTGGFSNKYLTGVEAFSMIYQKICVLYPRLKELTFLKSIMMKVNCCMLIVLAKDNQWDDEFAEMKSDIRKYIVVGMTSPDLSIQEKVKLFLMLFPQRSLRVLWRLMKKMQSKMLSWRMI